MDGMRIACSSITWGRDTPLEQVLSEIAQAGYEGAPASPRSGKTPKEVVEFYAGYGLTPGSGYLGADYWVPEERAGILERAKTLAAFMGGIGCTELYVASGGFGSHVTSSGKTRHQVSGHVSAEDALSDEQYAQFAKVLNEVGEITLKEGVRSCFHNHVGSMIETRQEIDKLFSLVDRDLVFQGPDIGHLAWAGDDVLSFCRDYADSIKTVHIKDINPDVLAKGVKEEWDYRTFSDNGIFAEIGEGFVDWPAMFAILQDAGYDGWIVVETDVTQKATPLESATISRNYLKSIGL